MSKKQEQQELTAEMPGRISIRKAELLNMLNISDSALHRWYTFGTFPKPFKDGHWYVKDVKEWQERNRHYKTDV